MGDTVVKLIKDATIWVGEITVLPNDEVSAVRRLKHGLYKASLGLIEPKGHLADEESGGKDDKHSKIRDIPPGLIKLFGNGGNDSGGEGGQRHQNEEMQDRMAEDFEAAEKQNEEEARELGDVPAEGQYNYFTPLI